MTGRQALGDIGRLQVRAMSSDTDCNVEGSDDADLSRGTSLGLRIL